MGAWSEGGMVGGMVGRELHTLVVAGGCVAIGCGHWWWWSITTISTLYVSLNKTMDRARVESRRFLRAPSGQSVSGTMLDCFYCFL